jgi:hypothetical protein
MPCGQVIPSRRRGAHSAIWHAGRRSLGPAQAWSLQGGYVGEVKSLYENERKPYANWGNSSDGTSPESRFCDRLVERQLLAADFQTQAQYLR